MFVRKGHALGSVLHSADPGVQPSAAPVAVEEPQKEPEKKQSVLERPKDYAVKADWVAYVVAKTADGENPVSEDDAEAMTKDDLIELYGGN